MYFEIEELIKEYPNKFIYAVIGARGCGKSYSVKRKLIKDFLSKGKQAMIFRRYVHQVDEIKDNYFEDIAQNEFSEYEFETKGNIVYIDGKVFAIYKGLNSNAVAKGSAFPNIYNVVYEEFMPESGERIIKNEYYKLESALFTIDRGQNRVTLYLLGNNTSFYNPIFDVLKLYPSPKENKCVQNDLMVIKNLKSSEEFKDKMKNSNIGKLSTLSGTSAYNIYNKNITNDNFNCVPKKSLPSINKLVALFQIRVANDKIIKIWWNTSEDGYYFIDNNSKANVKEFFYENDYQNKDNKHITLLNIYEQKKITLYNKVGGVFFNNPETKFYFETMLRYLRR